MFIFGTVGMRLCELVQKSACRRFRQTGTGKRACRRQFAVILTCNRDVGCLDPTDAGSRDLQFTLRLSTAINRYPEKDVGGPDIVGAGAHAKFEKGSSGRLG